MPGPLDVVAGSGCGALAHDPGRAITQALTIPRARCRDHASQFSWLRCVEQFLGNLHPIEGSAPAIAGSVASA